MLNRGATRTKVGNRAKREVLRRRHSVASNFVRAAVAPSLSCPPRRPCPRISRGLLAFRNGLSKGVPASSSASPVLAWVSCTSCTSHLRSIAAIMGHASRAIRLHAAHTPPMSSAPTLTLPACALSCPSTLRTLRHPSAHPAPACSHVRKHTPLPSA